jgi:hypothetical protein
MREPVRGARVRDNLHAFQWVSAGARKLLYKIYHGAVQKFTEKMIGHMALLKYFRFRRDNARTL